MANLVDNPIITYTDMVTHMRTGQPFNMTYVEADRRRGTGGELSSRLGWVIHNRKGLAEQIEQKKNRKSRIAQALYHCNPNHLVNKTCNITNLKSRAVLTIHLKLIIQYNGKTVVL